MTLLLNTLGLFNSSTVAFINKLGKFLIIMALSTIGLNSDF
ncbi:hypothetical protein [Clostridium thermarum]